MDEGRAMQEQLPSNSEPITTIRNTARREMQRAIQFVATYPMGELSRAIKRYIGQQVNISSKWSTAESRFRGD